MWKYVEWDDLQIVRLGCKLQGIFVCFDFETICTDVNEYL